MKIAVLGDSQLRYIDLNAIDNCEIRIFCAPGAGIENIAERDIFNEFKLYEPDYVQIFVGGNDINNMHQNIISDFKENFMAFTTLLDNIPSIKKYQFFEILPRCGNNKYISEAEFRTCRHSINRWLRKELDKGDF